MNRKSERDPVPGARRLDDAAAPPPVFTGPADTAQVVRSVTTEGFVVAETRHAPGQRLGRHAHENATVTLLLQGASQELAAVSGRITCAPGSALFRPPGVVHEDLFGPRGTRNVEIEVRPGELETLRRQTRVFDVHMLNDSPELNVFGRRIRSELAHDDAASGLALEGLTLEFLAAASRRPAREGRDDAAPPLWLLRVRDLLEDGAPFSIRLSAMAEGAGVSPTRLARVFRRHFGVTPGAYLRRARVDRASRAIERGDGSLAEIAAAAGFADQSHLGRAFKKERAVTPARYRDEVR